LENSSESNKEKRSKLPKNEKLHDVTVGSRLARQRERRRTKAFIPDGKSGPSVLPELLDFSTKE
jgi:hypothetical protein